MKPRPSGDRSAWRRDAYAKPPNPNPADHLYSDSFYQGLHDGSYRSARVVLTSLFDIYKPQSVVDIGCGVGSWIRAAADLGVDDVRGVDTPQARAAGLSVPTDRFLDRDLREPLDLGRHFDLAISVEVAEHLPAAAADTFVASLTNHAPVVLFSAAIPGQNGTGHVNEQWPDYWAARFADRGYETFDFLRSKIWANDNVEFWYRQNLLVFSSNPKLFPGIEPGVPLRLVHPEQFARAERSLSDLFADWISRRPPPIRTPANLAARANRWARRALANRTDG